MNFQRFDFIPGLEPYPPQTPTPRSSIENPGSISSPAQRPRHPPAPTLHQPPYTKLSQPLADRQPITPTATPRTSLDTFSSSSTIPIISPKDLLSSINQAIASPSGGKTVLRNVNLKTFDELQLLINNEMSVEKFKCVSLSFNLTLH
jgi:hypothetical protein